MGSYVQKYIATGLSLATVAYGIYGLAHKGIWVPARWGNGTGVLVAGPAGLVLFAGMVVLLVNQLYSLFALPPDLREDEIPKKIQALRLLPFVFIVASIFFPGISPREPFPY